jgi:hypothetical protein
MYPPRPRAFLDTVPPFPSRRHVWTRRDRLLPAQQRAPLGGISKARVAKSPIISVVMSAAEKVSRQRMALLPAARRNRRRNSRRAACFARSTRGSAGNRAPSDRAALQAPHALRTPPITAAKLSSSARRFHMVQAPSPSRSRPVASDSDRSPPDSGRWPGPRRLMCHLLALALARRGVG